MIDEKFSKKALAKVNNSEMRSITFNLTIGEPSAREEHILLVFGIKYRGQGDYKLKATYPDFYAISDLSCISHIF